MPPLHASDLLWVSVLVMVTFYRVYRSRRRSGQTKLAFLERYRFAGFRVPRERRCFSVSFDWKSSFRGFAKIVVKKWTCPSLWFVTH
jgi:hypothetical protein